MVAIVVESTVSAGYGAGFMWVFQLLIMFAAYVVVGSLGAVSNLRANKRFSLKVFNPIFDRIIRVGLIALSSVAFIVMMVNF